MFSNRKRMVQSYMYYKSQHRGMEEYFENQNASVHCDGDVHRDSCYIPIPEAGKIDSIAVLRAILSCLSILGAWSIITLILVKKQVLNPKVHPIFVLSLADFMLALLWVAGSLLWLRRGTVHHMTWCFFASLLTVILECITVNLTVVYAILAYSSIKTSDVSRLLVNLDHPVRVWHPRKTTTVYIIAWCLPVTLVMVPFGIIAGEYDIVGSAKSCSCWCFPVFGNVLPFALPADDQSLAFVNNISRLLLAYGIIVSAHYLVGFVILVITYRKVLLHISRLRTTHEQNQHTQNYGTTKVIIAKGESMARKRVVSFLTVFIITGFFNLVLSLAYAIYEAVVLNKGLHESDPFEKPFITPVYVYCAYLLQSITVPLQGFLNAIVYGWTREDFLNVLNASQVNVQKGDDNDDVNVDAAEPAWTTSSCMHQFSEKRVLVEVEEEPPEQLETEFEDD